MCYGLVTTPPYLSFVNTLPNARIANISFLTPRLAIGGDLLEICDAIRRLRDLHD